MQYQRIMSSIFREEDCQRFAVNCYVQIVLIYHFPNSVGGNNI